VGPARKEPQNPIADDDDDIYRVARG
jgi:hypothetical protein